jgi:hypothetical protein
MDNVRFDDNTSMIPQIDATTIIELLKQNNEFKQLLIEQNNKIMELASKNNTTINNTTNNNFNLQMFLNVQCKDALNIMDFVNSLKLQIKDLEEVGRLGYIDGISKIFINSDKLRDIDINFLYFLRASDNFYIN